MQQLTKKCNEKDKEINTRLPIVLSVTPEYASRKEKRSNLLTKLSCLPGGGGTAIYWLYRYVPL